MAQYTKNKQNFIVSFKCSLSPVYTFQCSFHASVCVCVCVYHSSNHDIFFSLRACTNGAWFEILQLSSKDSDSDSLCIRDGVWKMWRDCELPPGFQHCTSVYALGREMVWELH